MKCRADSDHVVEPILKYVLSLMNFIGFLISIGYIIGGAWLLYQHNNVTSTRTDVSSVFTLTNDLGGYLIALGIFGIIFTLIGIAATLRENIFLLRLYLFVLILILLLNVIIGTVFLIYSGKITTQVFDTINANVITDYSDDNDVQSLFDFIQSEYSCCGMQSYTDWNSNPYYTCNITLGSSLACFVPSSCCVNYNQQTNNFFCSGQVLQDEALLGNIYTTGCRQAIVNLAQYAMVVMSSIIIGVTVLLAITIILVQYLIILVRKEMALYNAKNKYRTLGEDVDTLDYIQ